MSLITIKDAGSKNLQHIGTNILSKQTAILSQQPTDHLELNAPIKFKKF
jgi:hypothetical protein